MSAQNSQFNLEEARLTIETALEQTLGLLAYCQHILSANIQSTDVKSLDITPLLDWPDGLLPCHSGDSSKDPVIIAMADIVRNLRQNFTKAQIRLLRFREFGEFGASDYSGDERWTEDPETWWWGDDPFEGFDDRRSVSYGAHFGTECLTLLGMGYFSAEQEEVIWQKFMVDARHNGQVWNDLCRLLKIWLGPDDLMRYPWQPRGHPDLQVEWKVRLWNRMKELVSAPNLELKLTGLAVSYLPDLLHEAGEKVETWVWDQHIRYHAQHPEELLFGVREFDMTRYDTPYNPPDFIRASIGLKLAALEADTCVKPMRGWESTYKAIRAQYPNVQVPEWLIHEAELEIVQLAIVRR